MNIPTWLVSSWAHLKELTAFQLSLIALNISLLLLSKPLFRLLLKSRQISETELFDSRAFILLRRANWVSLLCVALYAFVLPLN
jgi:hypothetical protein